MTPELRRLAFHESGHAAVRLVLSGPGTVAAVSLRPGRDLGAVTIHETLPLRQCAFQQWEAHGLDEVMRLPVEVRNEVEVDILVWLAGDVAGRLVPLTGYVADPACATAAVRAAESPAEMSRRHRELVERAEGNTHRPDETEALAMSELLAGEEAAFHLEWLRRVATRLDHERRESIGRLADHLLERQVISGTEAEEILLRPELERSTHAQPA